MSNRQTIFDKIDWLIVSLYSLLVILGWLNIFAAVYDENANQSIFDFSLNAGKQLIWIIACFFMVVVIMTIDFKIYSSFAYFFYLFTIALLALVLVLGKETGGARSWFEIGSIKIQPSEFAKVATALALAKFFEVPQVKIKYIKSFLSAIAILAMPVLLILLQPDPGTVLIFTSFIIVLYREGLSPIYIIIGLSLGAVFIMTLLIQPIYFIITVVVIALIIIGVNPKRKRVIAVSIIAVSIITVITSVDFIFHNVLKAHHRDRITALINPNADPLGYGWNVTQSKIAIGSGGFVGKGFLQGTQTKFDYVPEQSTDFIFCTIGEEHGWVGSVLIITLFTLLLYRIVIIAERQKSRFARVYGYSVAGIFFFHCIINIGMTIGLFPVVGIPLPFFSYGGSSLISFTLLLFILIKLDAHRMQVLER